MIVVSFFFISQFRQHLFLVLLYFHATSNPIRFSFSLIMISVSFDHLGTLYIFILSYLLNHMTSCCHDSYYLPGALGTAKINSLTKIWQQLFKAPLYFWPLRVEILHSG